MPTMVLMGLLGTASWGRSSWPAPTSVTAAGATIKDFAGDGILCLIGAPLPESAHAERALALGRVGGETRLEYAAVGPAVNLAARLCEHAVAGEILADAATIERAGPEDAVGFHPNGTLHLKGIARPVTTFRHALGAEPRASLLA